ncbi:metal-sensitive transcriptional regulator [uncultured Tessaracoccus sp.]|uniref:metal-sensitive transcriptional regulator n=1 Tax=uncultured Tessaracoccus sp. TaxID=905023 RepID=UPI0025D392A1|nr:metal-sensitive transcriptional regulator [uncultured Tessaracoccus sp.]
MSGPHGYTHDKAGYLRRLRLIEGQTRGIARMVEADEYCIDVLTQISAVRAALGAVSLGLLEDHLGHCVAHAIQHGGREVDEKLDEAMAAIRRMAK